MRLIKIALLSVIALITKSLRIILSDSRGKLNCFGIANEFIKK